MAINIDLGMLKTGLKAASNILEKWGCSASQIDMILVQPELDVRISYILNIHAKLRTLFENPDNVYGFMSKANNNPFFEGRSPLELILSGNLTALKSTYERIESIGDL